MECGNTAPDLSGPGNLKRESWVSKTRTLDPVLPGTCAIDPFVCHYSITVCDGVRDQRSVILTDQANEQGEQRLVTNDDTQGLGRTTQPITGVSFWNNTGSYET
ncbi:hypothetical protein RSOL_396590 [Rhizoctonia solani AG-3 Rhs1AP]|uniref:Uncharacterized protein n=2 Tax=Rhizoctonia solani AG-3 TaxID=1086053 RepID=A0A074SUE8_9AGAM|nr:hypothetical protein RSOL_396590 [Rhizoctonia solani AG-3 Rhs1AP]KEP53547.1 hypothetical protein V565_029220 [Rhizoctonia solani 123E]